LYADRISFPDDEYADVNYQDEEISFRYFRGASFESILPQTCGLVSDDKVYLRIVGGSEVARGKLAIHRTQVVGDKKKEKKIHVNRFKCL